MTSKIVFTAKKSELLINSLLDTIEKKDEQISEQRELCDSVKKIERRHEVSQEALNIIANFLSGGLGVEHADVMPKMVKAAMHTANTTDSLRTAEGALESVAWYLESDDRQENVDTYQEFVRIIKELEVELKNG